ncbi:hypothetical protein AURDEDRAFT_168643 [Auricularia subglabra TFB-10046 SS5]|nr:hypothetical protein AURDEDRAFT_168643 [Auricularia subglabra TFB-10046 SS5]
MSDSDEGLDAFMRRLRGRDGGSPASDSDGRSGDGDCDSDEDRNHASDASESDYEDDAPQEDTAPALPAHLKLPTELELRILDLAELTWTELWLDIRPVCTAWCAYVESIARRKWLRSLRATGRTAGPSYWDFHHLEDDGTAVFVDVKSTPGDAAVATHCRKTARPDIVLGHSVFKINVRRPSRALYACITSSLC